MADNRLNELIQKYQSAFRLLEIGGGRVDTLEIAGGVLRVRAESPGEDVSRTVWSAIEKIDARHADLDADIRVVAAAAPGSAEVYTVQLGDTLTRIAERFYGDASQYVRLYQANRKTVSDPEQLPPGQKLNIPKP